MLPRSELDQQLASIWKEVLAVKVIDPEDDFFDLGGNSLTALRILSSVQDVFSIELPVSVLTGAPRFCDFARVLMVTLQEGEARTDALPAASHRHS
jgi:acyl carrier protein